MITNARKILFLIVFLFLPTLAFAQDNAGIDIDLKQIIAVLIMGVGVPLAVQILKTVWPSAPSWLKGIAAPVIAPVLLFLGAMASQWLGVPIDFSAIIDVITATVAVGVGASMAFTMGKRKM